LRDETVFPHSSSNFIEGFGLANGFRLDPAIGYLSVSIEVPFEIESWNEELNQNIVTSVQVEIPLPTAQCSASQNLTVRKSLVVMVHLGQMEFTSGTRDQ
jgi:hypothetical protein